MLADLDALSRIDYAELTVGLSGGTCIMPTGVYPRKSATQRFWGKVDKAGPIPDYAPHLGNCWLWTAYASDEGYGQFWAGEKLVQAHRWPYEQKHGPIPSHLQPDHLCRVRHCVNDRHIELVTQQDNILRGESFSAQNATITHCPQGHPYDEVNTYRCDGRRHCRTCRRDQPRERMHRKRAIVRAVGIYA